MHLIGLLGKSLTHSFSQQYFTDFFHKNGIQNYVYENFELPHIQYLPELLQKHKNLIGFNITIPYKEEILPFIDYSDLAVKNIGATNCVKIINGKLHAFNTDIIGIKHSLQTFLPTNSDIKALILGSGGASKAVAYVLQKMTIPYQIISRKKDIHTLTYDELTPTLITTHRLIINTTPLGMYPNIATHPHIPYESITAHHLCYDLIYNPTTTIFLEKAQMQKANILNGLSMLKIQAEASWKIWTTA